MIYSTELPPSFKTWNELWNDLKNETAPDDTEAHYYYNHDFSNWLTYSVDFIKARCLDEIMELAQNCAPDDYYDVHKFIDDFEQLTHTKLFK